MTAKIITPAGGTPQYLLAIALRDNIIGSVVFTNEEDLEHFQKAFRTIQEFGFGSVMLTIDCGQK